MATVDFTEEAATGENAPDVTDGDAAVQVDRYIGVFISDHSFEHDHNMTDFLPGSFHMIVQQQ